MSEIDFDSVERLPCACEWCGRWTERGCIQAHFCEDFDWRNEEVTE